MPADPAFDNSRKPLATEWILKSTGEKFFFINVHLASKGGSTDLFGASARSATIDTDVFTMFCAVQFAMQRCCQIWLEWLWLTSMLEHFNITISAPPHRVCTRQQRKSCKLCTAHDVTWLTA